MGALPKTSTMGWSQKKQILATGVLTLLLLAILTTGLHQVMAGNRVGMDFHIFWLAGRSLSAQNPNPYSHQIDIEAQLGVLGRTSAPDEDQMGFAYPPYALIPVLAVSWLDYDWAQSAWMALNILCLVIALLMAAPSKPLVPIFLVLFTYPFTFGILLGNFVVILGAIFLVVISILIKNSLLTGWQQGVLGLVLAWTTIKPQFSWLYLGLILYIFLRQRKYILLVSFGIATVFNLVISFVIVPGWPELWLERIAEYAAYNQTYPQFLLMTRQVLPNPLDLLVFLALMISAFACLIVLVYRWERGQLDFLIVAAWCGMTTYLIHPRTVAYSQIVFFLPFFLWVCFSNRQSNMTRFLVGLAGLVLSWIVVSIEKSMGNALLTEDWRLLPYLFWLVWILLQQIPTKIWPVNRLKVS